MRIVFMGTPTFAETILNALANVHDVIAVYTQADAVRGRGKKLCPTPVKAAAESLNIPVHTPKTLTCENELETLKQLKPDAICVAAYGKILPKSVLELPKYGCLNVHASLLPRWRGAAPIERAILAGDAQVGICIMRMEEGLDTGDFCISRAIDVAGQNTTVLSDQLADLGAHGLLLALAQLEAGQKNIWLAQDNSKATYANKIERGELDITPTESAQTICRKIQASGTAHPSHAIIAGKEVVVLKANAVESEFNIESGKVAFVQKRLLLGTCDGTVELLKLKPAGKKEMDAKAFAAGVQGIKAGGTTWSSIDKK